jgi:FkbM family methyltransferase
MFSTLVQRSASHIARWLYPHDAVRKVLRGPHRGVRFQVVDGMGFTYALAADHWSFAFLAPRVHSGMVIFDLGANCGQMSLFFASLTGPDGEVIAIEPVPQNAARFRQNMKLSGFDQVTLIEAAAAADSVPRQFRMDVRKHTMGALDSSAPSTTALEWTQVFEVSCLTLDSLLPLHRPPDLLKIDVEGGGGDVIQGALQLLEKHRPAIFFELHAGAMDDPELNALRLLRDRFQYTIHRVNEPDVDPFQPGWGLAIWCEPPRKTL